MMERGVVNAQPQGVSKQPRTNTAVQDKSN